jgi:hypothetical protein
MLVASSTEEAEMPGERAHNRTDVIPFQLRQRSLRLVACSVCLRVWEENAWIEAGEVIPRLRTFEHDDVVRLGSSLCDRCEMELRLQRRSESDALAA